MKFDEYTLKWHIYSVFFTNPIKMKEPKMKTFSLPILFLNVSIAGIALAILPPFPIMRTFAESVPLFIVTVLFLLWLVSFMALAEKDHVPPLQRIFGVILAILLFWMIPQYSTISFIDWLATCFVFVFILLLASTRNSRWKEILPIPDGVARNPIPRPFAPGTKFKLFHEISSLLRDAPQPVRRAYQAGWTGIELYPNGYDARCPCNYYVRCAPGWYGCSPSKKTRQQQYICDPNGR